MELNRFYQGDVLEVLRSWPDGFIHMCMTSPPYWGLRDYGTARWEGGDPSCDHRQGRPGSGRADGVVDERGQRNRDGVGAMGGDCRACGARRIDDQIGLEDTPDAYVSRLVEVFREVRRVLRDDGTLWLNLGDSFAVKASKVPIGLKPKDLCGIPWRVAFALQADGWYLRSDIIWAKNNPMPESVTDRPTKSHEHLFLLAKSQRYFYDAEAIKEPLAEATIVRTKGKWHSDESSAMRAVGMGFRPERSAVNINRELAESIKNGKATRNCRDVWTIATRSYREAHFATFPPELCRRPILAGTSEGGIVLDPFAGSGTTCMVARNLQRNWLGIELNPEYILLAEKRLTQKVWWEN